jgi:hypothetical protein
MTKWSLPYKSFWQKTDDCWLSINEKNDAQNRKNDCFDLEKSRIFCGESLYFYIRSDLSAKNSVHRCVKEFRKICQYILYFEISPIFQYPHFTNFLGSALSQFWPFFGVYLKNNFLSTRISLISSITIVLNSLLDVVSNRSHTWQMIRWASVIYRPKWKSWYGKDLVLKDPVTFYWTGIER